MVLAANPSPSIDLRLLGPLSATVDDKPVAIGGPRQMAVLARLMLTPDQVVSMNQLVESVWDGDEPSQPQVAIRSYVSNLRRAIEPNRQPGSTDSCIASSPPGYRLEIDPISVDWVRFERLVNEGRRWLVDHDPKAAVGFLRQANELWGGDPCAGLPDSPFFVAHIARLTELKETAIELLFESLLALGDSNSVAAEVEAAIAENPLRERLTELGMLAFYRSGRQSEALALGRRLRNRLVEALGVDPSRSIEALELKILNHDSSLDQVVAEPPLPPRPRSLDQRPERNGDVGVGDAASVSPTLLETGPPIGRDSELAMLGSLQIALDAGRSATAIVTGEQGIGKSRLVRSVVEQMAASEVKIAWSRSVPGEPAALWPWAQIVLSLIGAHDDQLPFPITADLAPLAALGPSVAGALNLTQAGNQVADVVALNDDAAGNGRSGSSTKIVSGTTTVGSKSTTEPEVVIDLDSLSPVDSPATGRDPVRLDPVRPTTLEFDQADVMLAVTSLLERVARTSPLTVVVEDLQWADSGSIALLSYAASTLADRPVCFVLTWRETDMVADSVAAELRELSRLPALIRVELEGLADDAIAELAHSVGRPLSIEETASLHRRCDGNPLLVREVLAHSDMQVGNGRRWSTVIDAVTDRIERLPKPAPDALRAAALFRCSFSASSVAPLCGQSPALVQEAFNGAVLSGVLEELDPTNATYRFRQPLMAEVLSSQRLAVDAAGMHQKIGNQMLRDHDIPARLSSQFKGESIEVLGVDGYEVAYHLSKSPSPDDRLLAGMVSLALITHRLDMGRLAEIDSYVDIALAAASLSGTVDESDTRKMFMVDALLYRSWRAWIDGNSPSWSKWVDQALALAVTNCPPVKEGRTGSRGKSQPTSSDHALAERHHDRLDQAVMNVAARPILPVGPTDAGFVQFDPSVGGDRLNEAVERLSSDYPAKWVAQLHLAYLQGLGRPGCSGQQKVARDAQKIVSSARKRLDPVSFAAVLRTYVARFAESTDPEVSLSLLAEMARLEPAGRPAAFGARFAYPALLELGRIDEARQLLDSALTRALEQRQPFPVASTRLLFARHLLWTGEFSRVDDLVETALVDWKRLGLPEPLPLARQRIAVRVGLGQRADGHDGGDLLSPRMSSIGEAERALRLSRRGRTAEAIESLDAALDIAATQHLTLAEQAQMAVAASEVGHEKAAIGAAEMLRPYKDQLIVRRDGSMVLGPASLFAGVALKAAGDRRGSSPLFRSAAEAVQRYGGCPLPVDGLISDLF